MSTVATSVPLAASCPACGAPTERQRSVYGVIGAGAVVLLCSEACARDASGTSYSDKARELAQPCLRCGVRIDRHGCSTFGPLRCADDGAARSLIDPWFTRTHVERSPGVWELVKPLTHAPSPLTPKELDALPY